MLSIECQLTVLSVFSYCQMKIKFKNTSKNCCQIWMIINKSLYSHQTQKVIEIYSKYLIKIFIHWIKGDWSGCSAVGNKRLMAFWISVKDIDESLPGQSKRIRLRYVFGHSHKTAKHVSLSNYLTNLRKRTGRGSGILFKQKQIWNSYRYQ